jgi:glycosyltransferase involved in cell wall biosynthesis
MLVILLRLLPVKHNAFLYQQQVDHLIMRIGIDVRYLTHNLAGGIHTYLRCLVPELLAQAVNDEIVLYADTKAPIELINAPAYVQLKLLPYQNNFSLFTYYIRLYSAIARDNVDLMHFPANYGFAPRNVPTVITLHDAINVLPLGEILRGHRKNPRTLAMMTYLHLCSTAALRRASLVLTVSEHARREIARVSGYPAEQIVAIHHAPTPDLRRVADPSVLATLRQRYHLPARFVLADALKNPAVLLRAWQHLPVEQQRQLKVLFFCRHADPPAVVGKAVAEGIAQLVIRPPREDLIGLYSMAEAFVFPSWIEGFGIPLLEAMVCGAPIIASNRGAIPEVVGDAALLIDAEDDAALARHLMAILIDGHTAGALRQRGFAKTASYSWHNVAEQTLRSYQNAISNLQSPISNLKSQIS